MTSLATHDREPSPTDDAAHILIVDDDARIRSLLARYLGREGFRVTTATDPADARTRMAALAFDLLIVDVMMPGESGFDFVAWFAYRLRRCGRHPGSDADRAQRRAHGPDRRAGSWRRRLPRKTIRAARTGGCGSAPSCGACVRGRRRRRSRTARCAASSSVTSPTIWSGANCAAATAGAPHRARRGHSAHSRAGARRAPVAQCAGDTVWRQRTHDRRAGDAAAPQDRGGPHHSASSANGAWCRIPVSWPT